mmetsp:Transcript_12726/g.25465  ORF Transcript_12726/g.25465 Transcript_12726/m.25465 type:complete len:1100 (-) Transcript_12726:51-3350(-)
MVQYKDAALALLASIVVGQATSIQTYSTAAFMIPNNRWKDSAIITRTRSNSRRYSAIPYDERSSSSDSLQEQDRGFSSTGLLNLPDDDDEIVDALLAKKEERRVARQQSTRKPVYQVTLPIVVIRATVATTNENDVTATESSSDANGERLASLVAKGQDIAIANTVGMSLRQVYSGRRLSELALDVDTLRFQSFGGELQGRDVSEEETDKSLGSLEVLQNSVLKLVKESFDGVVVSSVTRGGLAWQAGVRAGDVLAATSATIGSKLWPKSTLDGVRSAISSRKVISSSMDFEFRRLTVDKVEAESVQSFELSLARPIGINVEDTDDGYVTVTGISDKASEVVANNIRIGDRVLSVESSIGGQMWDVYNTDGLTSAVTTRMPGQPVRIRFERVETIDEEAVTTRLPQPESAPSSKSTMTDAVDGFRRAGRVAAASEAPAAQAQQALPGFQSAAQKMLLSRSRDLLRTFIARNEVTKNLKVADRVIEAVVDSGAALDGRTLTLILTAYNMCNNADKTIATFEDVFGLAGDGSEKEVKRVHDGRLSADIAALNTFTISGLLRAHAVRGDYESALRVLAAMEGDAAMTIGGKPTRSWSGKGDPLNMLPDTRAYNIALAAAANRGTKDGLDAALSIFESMPNPSLSNPPLGKPAKNLVTFNTMINAYARFGHYEDALGVFKTLKESKLQPDRVTYTALIKTSIKSGNIEKALDILDDMKWASIKPDIVSYNTIIEALCNANRLFEAKDLINEMETAGLSPDSMTYGLLMKGLLRANKPGPCLTFFESACSDSRTVALTENVQLYTTAISAAAALGDHERALDLVARMNQAGVRPNKKTLTALMGACISGRKYEAAAEIFSKIKNPDSHAISVGLQALCMSGNFDSAVELITDQRSGQKTLSGKQVMSGFNSLLRSALESGEYDIAREALTSLLQAGYIPSKFTFQAMSEGLNLHRDMPRTAALLKARQRSLPSEGTFDFLLFVLDSLEARKLTVNSEFYSSILVLGAELGGLEMRISSILTRSRKNSNQKEVKISLDPTDVVAESRLILWEELYKNYSTLKEDLSNGAQLPSVRVPASKQFGRVLAAENAVSYRGRVAAGSRRR